MFFIILISGASCHMTFSLSACSAGSKSRLWSTFYHVDFLRLSIILVISSCLFLGIMDHRHQFCFSDAHEARASYVSQQADLSPSHTHFANCPFRSLLATSSPLQLVKIGSLMRFTNLTDNVRYNVGCTGLAKLIAGFLSLSHKRPLISIKANFLYGKPPFKTVGMP